MPEKPKASERNKTKTTARDTAKSTVREAAVKAVDRDKTLINILERMVGQIQRQDELLEKIVAHQKDSSSTAHSSNYNQLAFLDETDKSIGELRNMISRYRSDMLSLVNEQDHINKSVKDLNKLVKESTYASEVSNKRLATIDDRIVSQEKAVRDHYEHSLKLAVSFPREIAEASHKVDKLHADTEKRLGELHRETQSQLAKLQQETSRRLIALDGIDAALQTLLIRTEPPEKKPPWIVRIFGRVLNLFRVRLPLAVRKLMIRVKKQ